MQRTRLFLLKYGRALAQDVLQTIARGASDKAGLVCIALFILPWAALSLLRGNFDWLWSLAEIIAFALAFWWMTRSGAAPGIHINKPLIESLFAVLLVVLWVEWRAGICGRVFFFLPKELDCYSSIEYSTAPKILEMAVFPFLILLLTGYGLRAQAVNWSWRAWWVALPALIGLLGYGAYLHWDKPLEFAQNVWNFLLGAGLPEESLFRAVLLTRLEAWWRNPGWALFGSAAIFGFSHLAINYFVFTKQDWRETWITVLTFQMGFGFAFGFAFQRIRNIWPIVLLHSIVDAL